MTGDQADESARGGKKVGRRAGGIKEVERRICGYGGAMGPGTLRGVVDTKGFPVSMGYNVVGTQNELIL